MAKTKKPISKFLFRTPRILAIIFILFLALFSLDIFGQGYTFWETVLGLFMHNLPSIVLTIALIITRKHELVGAITFGLMGLIYITIVSFGQIDWQTKISWSLIVAGPAILTGALFLKCRLRKRK